MHYILTDNECKTCHIKLTEFEYEEKSSLCMECFRELYPALSSKSRENMVIKKRNKKYQKIIY